MIGLLWIPGNKLPPAVSIKLPEFWCPENGFPSDSVIVSFWVYFK